MKMKKILTVLAFAATSFSLMGMTSCGKKELSEEEKIKTWVEGYAYSSTYEGDYKVVDYWATFDTNEEIIDETNQIEAGSGYKYFHQRVVQEKSEDGTMVMSNKDIAVVKTVNDNGVERTKYYSEIVDDDGTTKEGSYVAPDYALFYFEDSQISFRIKEDFGKCGTNAETFVNELKQVYLENEAYEKEPNSIEWKKEKDGSISLHIKISDEYVNTDIKEYDATYQKSRYQDEIVYIVKDGRITSSRLNYHQEHFYEDATKNYANTYQYQTGYFYEFDQSTYDSFNIETDQTINEYYGHVRFVVEGQNFLYSDSSCLVGEEYTLENSKEYLAGLSDFMIHPSELEHPEEYLALYLDQEMTKPFTKMTMEEDVTLYVHFDLPEEWAVVLTVFKRKDGYTRVQLAYFEKVGSTFRCNYVFQDYDVISIDGKEIKEGDSTDILCSENRVYTVLYDAKQLVL